MSTKWLRFFCKLKHCFVFRAFVVDVESLTMSQIKRASVNTLSPRTRYSWNPAIDNA
jgi:hypothetical protein